MQGSPYAKDLHVTARRQNFIVRSRNSQAALFSSLDGAGGQKLTVNSVHIALSRVGESRLRPGHDRPKGKRVPTRPCIETCNEAIHPHKVLYVAVTLCEASILTMLNTHEALVRAKVHICAAALQQIGGRCACKM
jgi:hypothetical protein